MSWKCQFVTSKLDAPEFHPNPRSWKRVHALSMRSTSSQSLLAEHTSPTLSSSACLLSISTIPTKHPKTRTRILKSAGLLQIVVYAWRPPSLSCLVWDPIWFQWGIGVVCIYSIIMLMASQRGPKLRYRELTYPEKWQQKHSRTPSSSYSLNLPS